MQHDPDAPLPCTADEIEDALRQAQAGSPDALDALMTRLYGPGPPIASMLLRAAERLGRPRARQPPNSLKIPETNV